MAGYDPYTWVDGAVGNTPIVAAALNRLEQGVFDAHRNMPAVNVVSYLTANQRTGVASATAGFIQAYTEAAGAPLYVPAGTYRFDAPITAVGSTPLNITFAPGAVIVQGANVPVIDMTGPAIEASRALQSDAATGSYTVNASTTSLAVGDWILVSDNATWPGPKAALGGEYHRIQQIDGTTQLRVRGALDQAYTVARTGAIRRRVMINGTRIVGGTWTAATPANVTVPMIRLTGHANYHIADVDMRGAGGPGITLSGCVQGTISRPRFTDFINDEATSHFGYGIEAFGPCNDLIVRDPFMSGGRHVFTTNSSGTTPGVPRNIYVIGGTCTAMTETCFDSHEEGEYIHFINNTVHGTNNGGLKHRAPNSTIINPIVTNSDGTAIRFLEIATGGTLSGGLIDRNRGAGVNLRANTTITGDITIRNTTTAVQVEDGINGTTLDGLTTTGAVVYSGTSTGHTLTTKTTAGSFAVPSTVTFTRRDPRLWTGTQAQYDAITTKDANTVYVVGGQIVTSTTPQPTTPSTTTQPRLTRTSSGLIQRNAVNYRTGGVNAFQIIHNDYPTSRLMSHAEIDALLTATTTLKAGVVRAHTMGANIGPNAPHLVTGVTGTGANPTIAYNTAVWEVMDYAVKVASDKGLYLMVPMTDELGYYHGGKRQWVNFRRPGTVSLDGNVKSANSSTQRTAETFFYTDTQIVADFDKYISDWLNHVNQYTGRAYKDEPAIGVLELGNELWTAAQDAPSWASARAAKIKAIAPNLLVADGSATDGQALNSVSLASANIDIFGTHPYSTFGASDVTAQATQAASSGKAYHVGEYGWSKANAAAIEQAARNAGNVFFTAFWSLQNTGDLHNGGPGQNYGTDDASLYVPGADATQQTAVTRLQAHAQALIDGSGTSTAPVAATSDTFTGTTGAPIDTTNWQTYLQSASTITIQNNAAQLSVGVAGGYGDKATMVSRLAPVADSTVRYTFTPLDVTKEFYFQTAMRAQTTTDSIGDTSAYRLEVNNSGVASLVRRVSGASTAIGSTYTIPGWGSTVPVNVEFTTSGTTISVRLWTGSTRPTNPNITGTDSSVTAAGSTGIILNGGNAATTVAVKVDDWSRTTP